MQIGNMKLSTPVALGGGLLIFCSVCCIGSLGLTAVLEATRPPEQRTATAVTLARQNAEATTQAASRPANPPVSSTPRPSGAATVPPAPTTPPAPVVGTKDNPVPVGGEYVYTSRRDNGNTYSIVITGVSRGAAANGVVNSANQFNTKPAAGMEYALVQVKVTYLTAGNPSQFGTRLSQSDFRIVTGDNEVVETTSVVLPSKIEGEMIPGGSKEGMVPVMVKTGQPLKALVFKYANFGQEGAWYALPQ